MSKEQTPEVLTEKLIRALKSKAVLTERSKQLQQQIDDFRSREEVMNHLATELLERQRELNFMLHRASSVLHQLQDTNLALSTEFTHIVKELPAPQDSEWDETVSKVNSLFQKTHELASEMQSEIFRTTAESGTPLSWADLVGKTPTADESAPSPQVEAQVTEQVAQTVQETPVTKIPTIEVEPVCEQEIIQDAEICVAPEIPNEAETVNEPAAPAAHVEEAVPAENAAPPEEDKETEQILLHLENIEADWEKWRSEDNGSESAQKQGILSKLLNWGK